MVPRAYATRTEHIPRCGSESVNTAQHRYHDTHYLLFSPQMATTIFVYKSSRTITIGLLTAPFSYQREAASRGGHYKDCWCAPRI